MDLHSLHRPSAPAQQQAQQAAPVTTYSTKEEWARATETDMSRELDKARSHAAHWEGETVKMDRIARDALEKLHTKREAKKALKAEHEAARKDADAWRTRYKELAEAHTRHAADTQAQLAKAAHNAREQEELNTRDRRAAKELHDQAGQAQRAAKELHDQGQRAAKELHDQLGQARDQLAKARATIQQHEAERPAVQERLQVGGDAFRKLKAIEPRVKQLEGLEARAKQADALEARVQQLEADKRDKRAKAEQSRQLELDLLAAKEKVRAATMDASAKAVKTQACADMLARAEQVLKTCSQLYAAKNETSPLALALRDTTANISQFLLRLDQP